MFCHFVELIQWKGHNDELNDTLASDKKLLRTKI